VIEVAYGTWLQAAHYYNLDRPKSITVRSTEFLAEERRNYLIISCYGVVVGVARYAWVAWSAT